MGSSTDEALTREQIADEFLLMGWRTCQGHRSHALPRVRRPAARPARVALLREQGAIERTPEGRLRLTLAGFPLLDSVIADPRRVSAKSSEPPKPLGAG